MRYPLSLDKAGHYLQDKRNLAKKSKIKREGGYISRKGVKLNVGQAASYLTRQFRNAIFYFGI